VFIEAGLLALVVGLFARGKISNLAQIRLASIWFGAAALIMELGIKYAVSKGTWPVDDYLVILHGVSYIFLFIFLCKNRYLPGVQLLAAGFLLNFLAIIINSGLILGDFTLPWLTDVIQHPLRQGKVFSIGDLIISLGLFWLIYRIMTRPDGGSRLTSVRTMKL